MASPSPRRGLLSIKSHMLAGDNGPSLPVAIDLSSNESAFGPGTLALEAGKAAMAMPERYNENAQDDLAAAIGARFGHDPGRIVVGHGSDDLLARLARAYLSPGDELVRSQNGYPKVPNYAHANDAVPVNAPDKDFRASVDGLLASLTGRTKMVYIANPDNPTGTYLNAGEMRALHRALPPEVVLVVDAAYEEYVDADDFLPAAQLVDAAENVVMTRTFSKIFGMAGLRLGWAYGAPGIADAVRRIGITFPVSAPAFATALAAMHDRAHTQTVFKANQANRNWATAALREMGLKVYPSQGNFILVEFPDPSDAGRAQAALRNSGIATRRFAAKAFEPCLRITLGFEHEVKRAIGEIGRFLGRSA